MTNKATPSLREILAAPTTKNVQKHPAVKLVEKVEKRLFQVNGLGQVKPVYTTDEMWGLLRPPLISYFGSGEEERLRTWVYGLKGKGRVQVLNALLERLEAYHPGLTLPRRTAKPRREE